MSEHYSRHQDAIYLAGLQGRRPELELSYQGLKEQARRKLRPSAYDYVAGGAGTEDTMQANEEAFRRWRIVPRMLRDVAERDLSVSLFEQTHPAPLLLAPIGVQGLLHEEAESATARAAASLGLTYIHSTAASTAMEEIASQAPHGPRWFQLYWPRDPQLTGSFLERAEKSGFTAIMVTLDTRYLGYRPRDLARGFNPFLRGEGLANYFSDPVFRAALPAAPEEDAEPAIRHFLENFSDPSMTWDDFKGLRQMTSLPLLVKGILHPEDAQIALDVGADGIVVSNHGGRQVDGAIGALETLPAIRRKVPDEIPLLFDSGLRSGCDLLKALALGADAALLGRPYAWGLAADGEEGVREVLLRLLADFDLALALSGFSSPAQLQASDLKREGAAAD
ncbi:MAG TPA: alpha-hydroxy-acid oxidizing protein [Acidobacteriota bacterium]|nr:alpha-hydroxy-acid oxidizing protein [Acidobacteriota bacterium]